MPHIRIVKDFDQADYRSYEDGIAGMKLVDKNNSFDLVTSYDILTNKDYYLLFAFYAVTDSFNNYEDYIEYIGLYRTYNQAKANRDILNQSSNKVNILDLDGTGVLCSFNPPWKDYFSILRNLEIKAIRVLD